MDMEFEVIVPSVISSIVGYSVFTTAFGTRSSVPNQTETLSASTTRFS